MGAEQRLFLLIVDYTAFHINNLCTFIAAVQMSLDESSCQNGKGSSLDGI